MQNKLLKEYFTPQELKQMGVDPFAMGDVSSFQRKQTIAPPTAKPKNLSSLVLDYAEQSPTALRVSGGDPLKNLINFAADYVPGLSLEKAKREQDALGQKLALLDLIPGGGLLARKGITKMTRQERNPDYPNRRLSDKLTSDDVARILEDHGFVEADRYGKRMRLHEYEFTDDGKIKAFETITDDLGRAKTSQKTFNNPTIKAVRNYLQY